MTTPPDGTPHPVALRFLVWAAVSAAVAIAGSTDDWTAEGLTGGGGMLGEAKATLVAAIAVLVLLATRVPFVVLAVPALLIFVLPVKAFLDVAAAPGLTGATGSMYLTGAAGVSLLSCVVNQTLSTWPSRARRPPDRGDVGRDG